jgi:hypothetical protein
MTSRDTVGLSTKINKDQTFLRLLDCLQARLEESDYQEVQRAVRTLQSINRVRASLQHVGALDELPTRLAELNIPYPLQWENAWDRIRAVTIESLRVIREKVLRYADNAT